MLLCSYGDAESDAHAHAFLLLLPPDEDALDHQGDGLLLSLMGRSIIAMPVFVTSASYRTTALACFLSVYLSVSVSLFFPIQLVIPWM